MAAAACVGVGIYAAVTDTIANPIIFFVAAVLAFTYVSCLFLANNFIGEITSTIFSWGFVSLPGLIFELDLDGIIWFLTVKLLFWILGIALALACGILGVVLGAIVSPFTYPFALRKSFVHPEDCDD